MVELGQGNARTMEQEIAALQQQTEPAIVERMKALEEQIGTVQNENLDAWIGLSDLFSDFRMLGLMGAIVVFGFLVYKKRKEPPLFLNSAPLDDEIIKEIGTKKTPFDKFKERVGSEIEKMKLAKIEQDTAVVEPVLSTKESPPEVAEIVTQIMEDKALPTEETPSEVAEIVTQIMEEKKEKEGSGNDDSFGSSVANLFSKGRGD